MAHEVAKGAQVDLTSRNNTGGKTEDGSLAKDGDCDVRWSAASSHQAQQQENSDSQRIREASPPEPEANSTGEGSGLK